MSNRLNPEKNLVLLGFSSSVLAMILNALKVSGFDKKLIILENLPYKDDAPFDVGLMHTRLPYVDYKMNANDQLFMSLANTGAKQKLLDFFSSHFKIAQTQFVNVFHPFSSIADTCKLENGIYVGHVSVIEAYSQIRFGVFINRSVSIGHHTTIGEFSNINPGVHIAGNCNIGRGVGIGIGAVVFDHVSIGDGSIIGGGSVVTSDIPPGVVAYGNPCKVVRAIE